MAAASETLQGAWFKHISKQEHLNSAHEAMQKEQWLNRILTFLIAWFKSVLLLLSWQFTVHPSKASLM